ncbi:MAG: aminotransferase class IV [Bryobacteraceae bacterium]|jgi:branched-chain amino acid aminotransferase
MKDRSMHRFVLHNDQIHEATESVLMPGQVGLLAGWGVFSTLRVVEGVPFAYERHWERMRRDARALRVPFATDPDYIRSRVLRLIQANGAANATLRVAVVRNGGGIWQGPGDRDFDLIALTADMKDWGGGVKLSVHAQARHAACEFRGTKILSWALNLAMLEEAQEAGFDEVILLNERGEVSECTSANIFAAQGSQVWTPPLDSGCLPGVTRELLLEEVRVEGISTGERTLLPEDLERASEVFITSTTRGLLPVLSIEGRPVRQAGDIRRRLQEAFGRCVDAYVAQHSQNRLPSRS